LIAALFNLHTVRFGAVRWERGLYGVHRGVFPFLFKHKIILENFNINVMKEVQLQLNSIP